MKKHLNVHPFRYNALYIWVIMAITVFVAAFMLYVANAMYNAIYPIGSQLIQDMGTNSATSDSVEDFFKLGLPALAGLVLIGTALWGWVHSTRKGVPIE